MRIHGSDDSGSTLDIPVKVLKIKDYGIDEIFEKRLYFLIPFYIFNYEDRLEWYNEDEKKLTELVERSETLWADEF